MNSQNNNEPNSTQYKLHWSSNAFKAENSAFVDILNSRGVCYGMSVSWLRNILKNNRAITSIPYVNEAICVQDRFEFYMQYTLPSLIVLPLALLVFARTVLGVGVSDSILILVGIATLLSSGVVRSQLVDLVLRTVSQSKEHIRRDYTSYAEMLAAVWNSDDNSAGYILGVAPKTDDAGEGHACAFIKHENRGYIMLPNGGLYECITLQAVDFCMLRDGVFRELDAVPCTVTAESIKW